LKRRPIGVKKPNGHRTECAFLRTRCGVLRAAVSSIRWGMSHYANSKFRVADPTWLRGDGRVTAEGTRRRTPTDDFGTSNSSGISFSSTSGELPRRNVMMIIRYGV
jgi:hypothetical protein